MNRQDSPTAASDARRFDGKLLVTGAAGHLGANLVRRLLADGKELRVLLREGSNNAAVDGLDVECVYGDLRDLASLRAAARDVQAVYHCAANVSTIEGNAAHKREIYDSNVVGTRNMLRAAREANVERVVVTGSFSAVGYDLDDPTRPASESVPIYPFLPKLPYARSKEMVEHECLRAFAEGQDVVVATSCAILGPADFKPSRMGRTLLDFGWGKLPAYIPGGFEFVSSTDICAGHVLAMQRGRAGQKYTLSSGFLTIDELLGLFERVTGHPRPRLKLPPAVMAGIAEVSSFVLSNFFPAVTQPRFTPGAVRILRLERHADVSKARRDLSFEPTSILAAIEDAWSDFERRGLTPKVPLVAARPNWRQRLSLAGGASR